MDVITSIRDRLLPSTMDTEEARRAKELVRRLMDAKPEDQ